MCGISGFISFSGAAGSDFMARFIAAHELLRHRGLDDEGFILTTRNFQAGDAGQNTPRFPARSLFPYRHGNTHPALSSLPAINAGIPATAGLAHARLSVIDTSVSGHQPMASPDNETVISYNGEIYNYLEIRDELVGLGYFFSSGSDTEVVLAAYLQWGTDCFRRFNGMWAVAILEASGKLILCRDRFGIKPLYITETRGFTIFASEAKVITLFQDSFTPNPNACCEFLAYGIQQHGTETLFQGIDQVEPGTFVEITRVGKETGRYWHVDAEVTKAVASAGKAGLDSQTAFFRYFSDSIRLRLRSDVKVGGLLSGGIDSSLIAGFVMGVFGQTLKEGRYSFHSAVYDNPRHSERHLIENTASMHGTPVDFFTPEGAEAAKAFDTVLLDLESPVRTLSAVVSWMLYRHIRQNSDTVVLLSGQGSDEIFGGYTEHYYHRLKSLVSTLNFSAAARESAAFEKYRGIGRKEQAFRLLSSILETLCPFRMIQGWRKKRLLGRYTEKPFRPKAGFDPLTERLIHDVTLSPLREYLHYDDRASMAHTLETRLPFMDYRIVTLGLSMPPGSKIRKGESKAFLRNFARPYIHPNVLSEKRKLGFPSPHGPWVDKYFKELIAQTQTPGVVNLLPFLDGSLTAKPGEWADPSKPGIGWRMFCLARWAGVINEFRNSFGPAPKAASGYRAG